MYQAGMQNAIRMIRDIILNEIELCKNVQNTKCNEFLKLINNMDIDSKLAENAEIIYHPVAKKVFENYEELLPIYKACKDTL